MVRLPLFMKMCRRVCERGMTGVVQNNGTLYTPENIEELVRMGWGTVIISLDGPDAEFNDRIRGKGSFERATRSLRLFAETKRRLGVERPDLYFYSTLMKDNCFELPRMADLAHEVGANGICAGYVSGQWCKDLHLSREHLERMPALVEQARRRAQEFGLIANLKALEPRWRSKMRDHAWRTLFGPPQGLSGALCFYPWNSIEIRGDGSIGPCCQAHDVEAPTVHETSLKDLWTGPYMTGLRERIIENRAMPYCADCQTFLQQESERIRRLMQWHEVSQARDQLGSIRRAAFGLWEALQKGKQRLRSR